MNKTNTLDLLLASNLDKITRPAKEVEIKRLSGLTGGKVIFSCEALTTDEFFDIQETVSRSKSENVINEIKLFTLLKGVKSPDLKSKELMDKFDVPKPTEVVKKLLLPGEIQDIYDIISSLSGFGEDAVEEIKNE